MSVSAKQIEPPNYTQIPNVVFDYWLGKLKPAAGIVLLIMCRKIFGWHKSTDQISKNQLCKSSGLSKNTIQSAIEELEGAGLICKFQHKGEYGFEANTYGLKIDKPLDIIYSETPDQNLGGGGSKSDLGVGQELTQGRSKFDPTKERPSKERPTKDNKPATPALSEPAFGRVASSFFQKLKEANPKIKAPNLDKWANELRLLSKDSDHGNSIEDIQQVIDYILRSKPSSNGFCWANVILSPAALRKNFPKIWAEMNMQNKNSPEQKIETDRKLAKKIVEEFKKLRRKDLMTGPGYIEFNNGMTSEHCKIGEKNFKEKCLHQLKKRNLSVKGLI